MRLVLPLLALCLLVAGIPAAMPAADPAAPPPPPLPAAAGERFELRVRFDTPITPGREVRAVVTPGEAFLEKAAHAGGRFNVASGMLLPPAADGRYPLVLTYIAWQSEASNAMGATKAMLTPGRPEGFGTNAVGLSVTLVRAEP